MRIERLEIERWGHFSDFALDLFPAGGGLCLLVGENEAGKTTLREALRALLFGIPESSPFSFRFAPATLALRGSLVLGDGQQVEVRRRRGRGNTLTGKFAKSGLEFDEAELRARLRHPSEDLFINVFGFSQEELARGGEVLRQGDLRIALTSATMGAGANPHAIIQELAGAASALFKSSGHAPSINKRAAAMREKAQSLRRAQLRGEDYQRLVDERTTADQRAAELTAELDGLRRRDALVDHLIEAIRPRDELRALRDERRNLVVPAGLSPSSLEDYERLLTERTALLPTVRDLAAKLEKLGEQLGAVTVDTRILTSQASIDYLCDRSIVIAQARRDSEKLVVTVAEQRTDLETRTAGVRPGWTLDDLGRFRLSTQCRVAFEQTVSRHDQLLRQAEGAREQLTKLASSLEAARRTLSELPPRIEIAELEAVVDGWSGYRARAESLAKQEADRAKLERRIATLRRKLAPPWQGTDITSLPVPPVEEIVAAAQRSSQIQQDAERESQRRRERTQEVDRLRSELGTLEARGPIPSEEELHRLRQHRDTGWALVRRALAGDDITAALAEWAVKDELVSAYEASVRAVDQYADELRAQADVAARRDECLRTLRQRTGELEEVDKRLARLKDADEAAHRAWVSLWERCGFVPRAPDVMKRWLDEYHTLIELNGQLLDASSNCEQLCRAQQMYEQRLAAAVPDSEGAPDARHVEARQRLTNEKDRRAKESSLKQGIREDEEAQAHEAERLRTAEDALESWRPGWEQQLQSLGLSDDLEPVAAQRVLQAIEVLQQEHKAWRERSQRVEHMERNRQLFEEGVARLCRDVEHEASDGPAERIVKELREALDAAVEARRKQEELAGKQAEAREELARRQSHLDDCERKLSALRARADAADDEAFRAVAETVRRAHEIDTAMASQQRIIAQLRGVTPLADFEAQLDAAEARLLEAEREGLDAQIAERTKEQREATGKAAVAAANLRTLDQTSVAATLQAEIESQRAALREEISQYVELTLERVLLERQVKAFQELHQPALLAELSRLFAAITDGRYPRVFQPLGSEALRIADAQGGEKAPEQLSKGTREQLYLALRLAYVLQYCRSGEPLPIVLDDVLVHFDPRRAEQALRAIFALAKEFQVLFLTCHTHVVELARKIERAVHVIALPAAPM